MIPITRCSYRNETCKLATVWNDLNPVFVQAVFAITRTPLEASHIVLPLGCFFDCLEHAFAREYVHAWFRFVLDRQIADYQNNNYGNEPVVLRTKSKKKRGKPRKH